MKRSTLVLEVALLLSGCRGAPTNPPLAPRPAEKAADSDSARVASSSNEKGEVASVAPTEDTPMPPGPLVEAERDVSLEPLPHLTNFYARLRALRAARLSAADEKRTNEGVRALRVEWFGDSHSAADFLPDVVRRRLFDFAGSGGPGFLRVGLKDGRHGQAKFSLVGRFRHQPFLPAQRDVFDDGIFGFAGVRTIPTLGASFSARAKNTSKESGNFRVEVRLARGDRLAVRVGDERREVKGPFPEGAAATAEIAFVASLEEQLTIEFVAGTPEIFGASIETVRPGVVLDTIGINGARLATMLAWDERSFVESIARREPELVVFAFGTNEAFDATPLARYPEQYAAVLARVRKGAPNVECLVVGPPDVEAKSGGSLERVVKISDQLACIAEAEKCAFVDVRSLMGGEGGFTAFRNNSPAWARSDRVHLTIAGYEELGRRISDKLLPSTNALASSP